MYDRPQQSKVINQKVSFFVGPAGLLYVFLICSHVHNRILNSLNAFG